MAADPGLNLLVQAVSRCGTKQLFEEMAGVEVISSRPPRLWMQGRHRGREKEGERGREKREETRNERNRGGREEQVVDTVREEGKKRKRQKEKQKDKEKHKTHKKGQAKKQHIGGHVAQTDRQKESNRQHMTKKQR